MNEYERMQREIVPEDGSDVNFDDYLCMKEQLFAEYLMKAELLPTHFWLAENATGKLIHVDPVYEDEMGVYCLNDSFSQPKPKYWKEEEKRNG